jgi:gamma-glutamylcyclotransferase (GGCT)/AIG2-like uncharacterized protein YtfP
MAFLFVYGTLMRAYGDKKVHAPLSLYAEYVGLATCHGRLYEIDGYPGLVISDEAEVCGELYQVHHSKQLFEILDEYEGYDKANSESSEYIRQIVPVCLKEDGREVSAWIYVYNWRVEERKRIYSGDYTKKGSI